MNKKEYTDKDFEVIETQISMLLQYVNKFEAEIKIIKTNYHNLQTKVSRMGMDRY
jgi:hypothetical protein